MNPSAVPHRDDPRRRLFALGVLLLVSLGLAAALAVQAIGTVRRHRETAERTLHDYAEFGAFILASQSYRQLGGALAGTLASWNATGQPVPVPASLACAGGPAYLEQNPVAAPLRLTGAALPPAIAASLRDTLADANRLLAEAGWRFRFIRAPAGGPDGFVVTTHKLPSGAYALRGFSVCLSRDSSPFRRVMQAERALPPSVTGGLPADSLYSITVTAGRGGVLFRSPTEYRSPYTGTATLGTEFGDLAVHLQLRPDLASRLVIGGVPSSPTPLALGLLGLSTLLVATALVQMRREYELIAIRSDFVSNVSHELRTPLSQILIFTELLALRRLRSPAERRRALRVIEQETRRLIRLVENVLQFSRAGVAHRRLDRETISLELAVAETLDAFRPLAEAREVTLGAEVEPNASVRADRSALRQVLLNLLDNAVKYGPRGQRVQVRAAAEEGAMRIAVDDEGPGIPAEDRERVWQGYYRLHRERGSAVAGSGIGLAVVRTLVDEMGGRAWIEEAEHGGARVVVELAAGEVTA